MLIKHYYNQYLIVTKLELFKKKIFKSWSNETVTKAFKLKFSCGNAGYQEILRQKIRVPSLRTLSRRLENLKFDSGILDQVFDFLQIKVASFNEHEKVCGIVLDEMSIATSNIYGTSTRKYIGNITLPGHSGRATNALVIMLVSISSRWKQTVAYYFTGRLFIYLFI